MKNKLRSYDDLLEEYLQNPKFAIKFLNQALADEDVDAFTMSLKDIIRIRGNITDLAKEADVSRGTVYRIINGQGHAEIGTVLKLMHALGYDLTVKKRPNSLSL
ncbi:MAG: addiction module antidote protein [Waddliaceae bacterium]